MSEIFIVPILAVGLVVGAFIQGAWSYGDINSRIRKSNDGALRSIELAESWELRYNQMERNFNTMDQAFRDMQAANTKNEQNARQCLDGWRKTVAELRKAGSTP